MAVASSGKRIQSIIHARNRSSFLIGTGEFLMKSLFSKSISDACAEDDLTPETVQNHINRIFLSK